MVVGFRRMNDISSLIDRRTKMVNGDSTGTALYKQWIRILRPMLANEKARLEMPG